MNRTADQITRRLAVLAAVALIVTTAILSFPQPNDSHNALDFSMYYCAAQIVRQGLGKRLFDIGLQTTFLSRVGVVHAFYNHPPYEALLYVPFTYLTYRTAYIAWTLLNVILLAASTQIIIRTTGIRQALSKYIRMPADFGLVFAVFLTFAPVTTCLLLGQDSMIVLLIYSAGFALFRNRSDRVAACVFALALFKFQLVLPLVFIIALQRRWVFIKAFLVSAAVLVLVSMAICGAKVLTEYPRFLLFESAHPELAGFQPIAMPNLRGLLSLISAEKLPPLYLACICAALSTAVLWFVANQWNASHAQWSFSASLLAVVLVSFHIYNYDLSLLLLAVAILCGEMAQRGSLLSANLTNAALCALFVHPLHRFLLLHGLYAIFSIPLVVLLFKAAKMTEGIARAKLNSGMTPACSGP